MTEHDDGIDAARAALITRNIDLAFAMLGELVDDPAKAEQIPTGATVFVTPEGDPEFNADQLRRALAAGAAGKSAYLWRLGAPPDELSALRVETLAPRWPTAGIDPVAIYNRDLDVLVVDFFSNRRRGTLEINTRQFGVLYVDHETGEVVANLLPDFLGKVVPRDPTLIDVLLLPETELRGIVREEVVRMRNALLHADAPTASFATITEHLELLSA